MRDHLLGFPPIAALIAEQFAMPATPRTSPAPLRFTAEEQQARRNIDGAWLWVNGERDAPPKPRYALVHVDVDVSSFAFNVGDRVRIKDTTLLGTVERLDQDGDPSVRFDGAVHAHVYFTHGIELVERAKPAEAPWIEWKAGDPQPVSDDTLVEVRTTMKTYSQRTANLCSWTRSSSLIAYRVVS